MWSWIERWNVRRKLARGRCEYCQATLRDDEKTVFCSDHCAVEQLSRRAY